jgi:hypothetical protein
MVRYGGNSGGIAVRGMLGRTFTAMPALASGNTVVGRMRWSTCQVRPAALSGHLEDEVCRSTALLDLIGHLIPAVHADVTSDQAPLSGYATDKYYCYRPQ